MRAIIAIAFILEGCSDNGVPRLVQPDEPPVPGPPLVPTIDVRDFGARGDDQTDDSAALNAAIQALPATGGKIVIPEGTYLLTAIHSNPLHVLDLSSMRNITIEGQGAEATVLRMAPNSYNSAIHIILIRESSGVTLKGLTLDGNRGPVLYQDEQSHGIQIVSSRDIRIDGIRFQHSAGDGVRLFGSVDAWTEEVIIENSTFQDNARNGISLQRASRNVVIRGNTFERISDQSISAEPTGNGAPTVILVEGNLIRHESKNMAVALAGIGPKFPLTQLTFRNNRLENAAAHFLWTDSLIVEDNVIFGDAYHSPLRLEDVNDAIVANNELHGFAQEGTGTLQLLNDDGDLPSRIVVRNNWLKVGEGLSGIYVRDGWRDIAITDNEIQGAGGTAGIRFDNIRANGTLRRGISVVTNRVLNFRIAISFVSRGDLFSDVVIESNSIDADPSSVFDTIGILFAGTGPYQRFALVVSNVMGNGIGTRISVRQN